MPRQHSNGLAAVVSLISINVAPILAPILFLPPGRRDTGKPLQQPSRGIPTIGVGGILRLREQRRIRPGGLTSPARRTVRCTAVAVAANRGTSPNTVLHRVGLRELAAPAASMVTCGGTAL